MEDRLGCPVVGQRHWQPVDKLTDFRAWEAKIMQSAGNSDNDRSVAVGAMVEVTTSFSGLIAEKRQNLDTLGDDIISHAV